MLGWHISVYRKSHDVGEPASVDSDRGALLAQWQGDIGALDWIRELVQVGQCTDLGGDGYPFQFTMRAEVARPVLLAGPPDAREVWIHDEGDIIDWNVWKGKTFVDQETLVGVPSGEWLLVVAWDES